MTALSWIMLVLVGGIVWGGFAAFLALALRREGNRGDSSGIRSESK